MINVSAPIRTALLADSYLTTRLAVWAGSHAVFTRRPVPDGVGFPMIIVSPDIIIGNEDAINSERPVVTRDVSVYGQQPDQYRVAEEIGYRLRELFHRQKFALTLSGYRVTDIVVSGPFPAPTDDAREVGRMISMNIRLHIV